MPRGAFEDFVATRTSEDGSDLAGRLNELFDVLNTPAERRLTNLDEQLAAFPYVNGKLFEENLRTASFDHEMRDTLLQCCQLDWGTISPAIFGSLFQGIMDAKVRRNLGAHYTSEKNILKVIHPLFLDDLRAEFEKSRNRPARLREFHQKLSRLKFLDPACGCGNFLVITYREIRLLELEVIKLLHLKEQQQLTMDVVQSYVQVDVDQFHGIEIEEWPAQIAQVAMWLIDHQMNLLVGQTFGNAIIRIPLVKSANIVHGNALTTDWSAVLPSRDCAYILGNPPFLGKKEQTAGQKRDFASVMKEVPKHKVLDFVSAWYVKAASYMAPEARCAFVSTNSITQGEQVGALWSWLLAGGIHIHFAHRTFQWSNEAKGVAAVHCVIIGFAKHERDRKIIFEYESLKGEAHPIQASHISPYLVESGDVLLPNRRSAICNVPEMTYGSFALDDGKYTLSAEDVDEILREDSRAEQFIRPFIGGKELIRNEARWCLWLKDAPPGAIRSIRPIMERVAHVRDWRRSRDRATTRALAETPTMFAEIRQPDVPYLAMPTLSSEQRRYIPAAMLGADVIASNQVYVLAGATPFHFGVLTSQMHMAWVRTVCGRFKSDYRYSVGIVYNNYPWPTDASDTQKSAVEAAAAKVLEIRAKYPAASLADLYDWRAMPVDLVKAHQALDSAVDAAYVPSGGKRKWASDAERVAFLFELYQHIVGRGT